MQASRQNHTKYLLWLIPLSFFTFQFILRLFPSLIIKQVMQKFSIDATAFGILASAYYYGYAGAQIPIAIALDRYGVKRVLSSCVFVCAGAIYLFSITHYWYITIFCRFLIGASSAVAILATSKIINDNFPKEIYSRMIGLTFTVGLLGAIYGGRPTNKLIDQFGWQNVGIYLAIIATLIGTVTFICMQGDDNAKEYKKPFEIIAFKSLLKSPRIWALALVNLLMVGALEGFADVWGINYLTAAYNYTKSQAAELTSFIFVGMLFGGPLLAIIGRYIGNYQTIALCGLIMSIIFFRIIIGPDDLNWYSLATLLFTVGIMCCYQVLIFAVGGNLVDNTLLSIAIAFLNCFNMLGGSFFHTVIGSLMDIFWLGDMENGLRKYSLYSYNIALLIIPICALLGALIIISIKPKKII